MSPAKHANLSGKSTISKEYVMTSNNGKPTNINAARNMTPGQRAFEMLKKDMKENPELWAATAAGVISGLLLARGLGWKRVPPVNEAAIMNKWFAEMTAQGINIYGLTNQQKELWEQVWAFATLQSKRPGWDMTRVVRRMVQDYSDIMEHHARLA